MMTPRYQDYLNQLAGGECYGLFVDDTGSPGLKNTPPNLHPERKSWVAVCIAPELMPEILQQFPQALAELQRLSGATEFHFGDIYAGRGPFKRLDLQARIAIFAFMAHIFSVYRFPIIVQTFDPLTLADMRFQILGGLPERVPPFNLTEPEDRALFFLLVRLKWFMQATTTYPAVQARVFVDEGFKKNGVVLKIPTFEPAFADGQVCFASSSSILPIQLADFAAFALNRSQIVGGKEQRGSLDNRMLEILSPIAWNYQNIEKRVVRPSHEGPIIKTPQARDDTIA